MILWVCHRQIEATKLAFIDGLRYIADPRYMEVSPEEMLSPEYAAARRKLIGQTAIEPAPGNPKNPGTVYLCAADNEGNMISYIQSNYAWFCCGVVLRHGHCPCRTGARASPWIRKAPTPQRRASGLTTPSSPDSSQKTANRWAPLG